MYAQLYWNYLKCLEMTSVVNWHYKIDLKLICRLICLDFLKHMDYFIYVIADSKDTFYVLWPGSIWILFSSGTTNNLCWMKLQVSNCLVSWQCNSFPPCFFIFIKCSNTLWNSQCLLGCWYKPARPTAHRDSKNHSALADGSSCPYQRQEKWFPLAFISLFHLFPLPLGYLSFPAMHTHGRGWPVFMVTGKIIKKKGCKSCHLLWLALAFMFGYPGVFFLKVLGSCN